MTDVARGLRAAHSWLFCRGNIVAAVAQTIVARFALVGINAATGIITARVLSADGRGEQSAMSLWPALLCYMLTLGFPSAIRYWARKEPSRLAEFYSVSAAAALVLSLVAFGIGVAIMPISLHAYAPGVVRDARFLMLFAPESMLGLLALGMLEALGDFTHANTIRYLAAGMTLTALLVLAVCHVLTPFVSALAYLVPPALTTSYLIWHLRQYLAWRWFDPRHALRRLTSYGLRSYPVELLATLSNQIDQVLVVGLLNAGEMGIYTVALAASRVAQAVHIAVVTVLFPSASGLDRQRALAAVGRAARVSSGIAVAIGVPIAALFPLVIPAVYGPAFIAAVQIAQLLTIEALIGGLVYVLGQSFMVVGRPEIMALVQGAGLVAGIPLLILLLPRLGLLGAAIALLASTGVRLALLMAAFPIVLRVPMPSLVPQADDIGSLRRAMRTRV